MARPLRRPKEITYPNQPWQGIARVTVRRKDYRFDGDYGSPESVEQHAEWVRIYDETGNPPEIETVRASLHIQRQRIPLPSSYEAREEVRVPDRFPLAMATAIACTVLLSASLIGSSLLGTVPAEPPMTPAGTQTSASSLNAGQFSAAEVAKIRDLLSQPVHAQPTEVFVRSQPGTSKVVQNLDDLRADLNRRTIEERSRKLGNLTAQEAAEFRRDNGIEHTKSIQQIDALSP